MGITSTVSKQVYDVLIHTHQIQNEVNQHMVAPVPTDAMRPKTRLTQYSKIPWATYLQNGGQRRTKLIFGPDRDTEFRAYINRTPNELAAQLEGVNYSPHSFQGTFPLSAQTLLDSKPGISESMRDSKVAELFECSGDDYSITIIHDFNFDDDGRKEHMMSLGILDKNYYFKNPMHSMMTNATCINSWNADFMPESEQRFYCVNFFPQNLNTYDQLFNDWSQCGYIKFRDENVVIPKRGSKDIIFTSSHLKLDPQDDHHGGTIAPGRAYELKSNTRQFSTDNSGTIIHLWRE